MAQAYNHTILPLSSRQDKVTQVEWGIADFRHRFDRRPEGLWLPETAADLETLEVLVEAGIHYTILAPWQSLDENFEPTEPQQIDLGSGKSITTFFYQQNLSSQISFDPQTTVNADQFASQYLRHQFQDWKLSGGEPQVLMVASDGELYGHHQPLRSYFLARLVDGAGSQAALNLSYPSRWLREFPASQWTRLREDTSWSCHHGLGRWTGECSCTPGERMWKNHLRRAFDHLSGALDGLYLELTQPYFLNPWLLRNRYIHVLLGEMTVDQLFLELAVKPLKSHISRRIHEMLEAQRERQRMFTSCGWFFEDFDRIEPRNNVAYAAQAVYLAFKATGVDLAPQVLDDLHLVVSEKTGHRASDIFSDHLNLSHCSTRSKIGFAD